MQSLVRTVVLSLLLLILAGAAYAQPLDVTFRYVPRPGDDFVRVYLPGEFNNWGPNNGGCIAAEAPSLMTYDADLDQWLYTTTLLAGQTYQYKVHFHFTESGSGCGNNWVSDPLNDRTNPADNNNSVVTITDPMVFQMARREDESGAIVEVSAGVFGTEALADLTVELNGVAQDGLPFFDAATGIFRYILPQPIAAGSQFKLTAVDAAGATVSAEVGTLLQPASWVTPDFSTFRDEVTVHGRVTRPDGTIDPAVTEATLIANGVEQPVEVDDGAVEAVVAVEVGGNDLLLRTTQGEDTFTSDPLVVTRRRHPLHDALITGAEVTGTGDAFQVALTLADELPLNQAFIWRFDDASSTAQLVSGPTDTRLTGGQFDGVASGPGALYLDVFGGDIAAPSDDTYRFEARVAVIIEEDGTARAMRYEETPAWVNKAVVYEIFPLSFGPQASGTPENPGQRFRQITDELDYLAQMGFTVLWFMPIMHNQFMDPLSGGYNIIDFYNVDPKLGTNEDFKQLVERAHELGLKVILDITPNHASPIHPWVESLRALGAASPYASYIQTTPSSHNRGLDNRGPNLPEVWQTEGGRSLYRKYDGFGDLANLNWDDDDLQATFLDIIAHWVREFDIDGWRFDVYWGPWRRYGPERFGRPIRDLMKRLKPDAWILGEIAGTGFSTEVYYADADNGEAVVGGMDAGYDWNFYHNAIRGTYGDLGTYDDAAHNGDFWPGPNARFFRFLENHDEERIAKLFATQPNRLMPLTGFLMTTTGIPMVYQGQEVGFGNVPGDARRRSVDWEKEDNGAFARHHQALAHTRTRFPAFWTQDLVTLSTSNQTYAYVRPWLDENAVVLINFAGSPRTVTVDPTPHVVMTTDGPVPYTDLFADTTFVDQELDGFQVTVPAYETVVFITADDVPFNLPDLPPLPFGAVYTASEDAPEGPGTFRLEQNYPNPFNPVTTIRYTLPEAARVRLDVFDVLGRRVATLVDGPQLPGTHEVVFNAGARPSGLYLYRLQAGRRTEMRRMMLVK